MRVGEIRVFQINLCFGEKLDFWATFIFLEKIIFGKILFFDKTFRFLGILLFLTFRTMIFIFSKFCALQKK